MAFITQTKSSVFSHALHSFLGRLGAIMSASLAANARVARMDRMQAKTDAELAQMGLRREDIARHVFRDILYL